MPTTTKAPETQAEPGVGAPADPAAPAAEIIDIDSAAFKDAVLKSTEARTAGLLKSREAHEREKKAALERVSSYAPLGSPEELVAELAELAELRNAARAAKAEESPRDFEAELAAGVAADRARQEKLNSGAEAVRQAEIDELKQTVKMIEDQEARNFLRAALITELPQNTFHGDSLPHVVKMLLPYVVRRDDQIRFEHEGTMIAGGTDGFMDLAELVRLPDTREVLGPAVDLRYFKVDNSSGSATTSVVKTKHGGTNWWKFTPAERHAYSREYGSAEVQKLIDKSPRPTAA